MDPAAVRPVHPSLSSSTRSRRPSRTGALLAVALTLTIVAAGCSGDDDEAAGPSTAPSSTTTISEETTTTSGQTATSGSATTAATTTAKALPAFQTPTGNITCFMDAETGVACEIGEYSFTPPPKEPSCEFDWGQRLSVGPVGAGFDCYSDSLRGDPQPVLAYGEASKAGSYECVSREDGLRCTNLDNGRGFVLSRARYEFF